MPGSQIRSDIWFMVAEELEATAALWGLEIIVLIIWGVPGSKSLEFGHAKEFP